MGKRGWGGVLLGALGMLACDEELADVGGEALRDAGELLADAGAALTDAGSDGASAQSDAAAGGNGRPIAPASEVYEAACDQVYEKVTVYSFDDPSKVLTSRAGTYTYTERYAVVPMDTTSVVGADVRRCGRESFGTETGDRACTPKSESWGSITCRGVEQLHAADCDVGTPASVEPGYLRIACGARTHVVCHSETSGKDCQDVDRGALYGTVTVIVRRR